MEMETYHRTMELRSYHRTMEFPFLRVREILDRTMGLPYTTTMGSPCHTMDLELQIEIEIAETSLVLGYADHVPVSTVFAIETVGLLTYPHMA